MTTNPTFQGWLAHGPAAIHGKMEWATYAPKPFTAHDVDIAITHCGVCGSDCSHIKSSWRPADYPLVVGHEIVGRAVRVGAAVSDIRVGDRVGVGAQCNACLRADCPRCSRGLEQHCENAFVTTYDARWPDGSKAYGGYAQLWRGSAAFVFKIPDGVSSECAAPMLCGGVTVYAPLKDYGVGPGVRVGVAGLGGLGHFAVLFAATMGASVTVLSRTGDKREDATRMGAERYIATAEEDDYATKYAGSLDLIICTVSGPGLQVAQYLNLLDAKGTMVQVGAPEDPIPGFSAFALLRRGVKLGGSLIGNRATIREMLEFAAENKVESWVNVTPMAQANEVIQDMENGKARYRYVLANDS